MPSSRPFPIALVALLCVAAAAPAFSAEPLEIRPQVATSSGEVARAAEATDGFPDTHMGMAVRGPDQVLLTSVLFGFDSGEARDWVVYVDSDAAATGATDQVALHIELSTDRGRTYESIRNDRAHFDRTEFEIPAGDRTASDVRLKLTLYLKSNAKAAGVVNVHQVYMREAAPPAGVIAHPYLATSEGEIYRPEEASDGFVDTAAGLAVRGPEAVALSRMLFGFHSDEDHPWTLHMEYDATSAGKVELVSHNIEVSTDGGRNYRSVKQGAAHASMFAYQFDVGQAKASQVRVRMTLYLVRDDAASGAINLSEIFLSAPE